MIDKSFLENFMLISRELEQLNDTLVWSVDNNRTGCTKHDQKYIKPWQIPRTTAEFLRFCVLTTKSKNILELGTSIGYSTIWLALGAIDTGGHVDTIEIFEPKIELAKRNIIRAKVKKEVTIHEGDISSILTSWDEKRKFDMIFLDADKPNYGRYYDQVMPILKTGGLLVELVDNKSDMKSYSCRGGDINV